MASIKIGKIQTLYNAASGNQKEMPNKNISISQHVLKNIYYSIFVLVKNGSKREPKCKRMVWETVAHL